MRVMPQCVPLFSCRLSWAGSSPSASQCWLFSLQRQGTWLLNMFCASTPCSQLPPNPAHPNFPSKAATAGRAGCQHFQEQPGNVCPGECIGVRWGRLCRMTRKIPGPPGLIPMVSYWTLLGLRCARVSWSCYPLHTLAVGSNEDFIGKICCGGWKCL